MLFSFCDCWTMAIVLLFYLQICADNLQLKFKLEHEKFSFMKLSGGHQPTFSIHCDWINLLRLLLASATTTTTTTAAAATELQMFCLPWISINLAIALLFFLYAYKHFFFPHLFKRIYLWPQKSWHNGNIHKITWLITGLSFKFSNQ